MPKAKKTVPAAKAKRVKKDAAPAPKENFMKRLLKERAQASQNKPAQSQSQFHSNGAHFEAHARVEDNSRAARRRSAS